MKLIKYFLNRFTIMFTIININYLVFSVFIEKNEPFIQISCEIVGLALMFSIVLLALEIASNKVKWLNGKLFPFVQYLLLLMIIVPWASYYNWGDWTDKIYVAIFIGSFTVVYGIVYLLLASKNKKDDEDMLKSLEVYKKKSI